MNKCQVCGKTLKASRWANCSDRCRVKNASDRRTRRGRFQVFVTFDPVSAHLLRARAGLGLGHGAVTRFVREAVLRALRGRP